MAALGLAAFGAGAIWVQQLRVEAARCRGADDAQELVQRLTDRVVDGIRQESDEVIETMRDSTAESDKGCLDAKGPASAIDYLRE
jgi:hypothetical protein